jgi:ABC-type transporter Mla subunit MlaD
LKELDAKFSEMGKTLDQLNAFYGGLRNVSETISSSVGEAAKTKDQLSALANNLSELNAVYSNMIHAIKGK